MNEEQLKDLLKQDKTMNEKISFYLKHKTLTEQTPNKQEINGHIEKAEHNLNFVQAVLDLKEFNDWVVVGCYYSIYHIALALILKKGYFSKNHDATLCILIKEYYKKDLTEEDIKLMNEAYIDNEDVLIYTQSKEEREKASYSTQIVFDKDKIEDLRQKALIFIRKAQGLLR
jgi:uncharacterized protein (UPF0332 family)